MSNASNSDRPEGCLSPKEFARRAGVSKSTVDRYLKQGLLSKVQRRKGYRVWIPERELYSAVICPQSQHLPEASDHESAGVRQEKTVETLPGKVPAWMKGLHNTITKTGGSDAKKEQEG